MTTRVIPFFYPIQFTTNWISITNQKCLCTAHRHTQKIHPSVHPKVGSLDLRGGCGAEGAAAAVAAVASLAEEAESESAE